MTPFKSQAFTFPKFEICIRQSEILSSDKSLGVLKTQRLALPHCHDRFVLLPTLSDVPMSPHCSSRLVILPNGQPHWMILSCDSNLFRQCRQWQFHSNVTSSEKGTQQALAGKQWANFDAEVNMSLKAMLQASKTVCLAGSCRVCQGLQAWEWCHSGSCCYLGRSAWLLRLGILIGWSPVICPGKVQNPGKAAENDF